MSRMRCRIFSVPFIAYLFRLAADIARGDVQCGCYAGIRRLALMTRISTRLLVQMVVARKPGVSHFPSPMARRRVTGTVPFKTVRALLALAGTRS